MLAFLPVDRHNLVEFLASPHAGHNSVDLTSGCNSVELMTFLYSDYELVASKVNAFADFGLEIQQTRSASRSDSAKGEAVALEAECAAQITYFHSWRAATKTEMTAGTLESVWCAKVPPHEPS
jgi:hypothetical protein